MWKQIAYGAILVPALGVLALVGGAAAEETETADGPTEIGGQVRDFTITDLEGRPFQLAKATHTRAEITASVVAGAAKFGAGRDAALETKLESLSGVGADAEKKKALACAVGSYYGMTATATSAAAFATLADLVGWIEAGVKGPIVFIVWSPNCPWVKLQNERILDFAATSKVRTYAIASNTRDTDEDHADFCEQHGFTLRIFPDRDQRVTDILGGKTTPHFFLLDAQGVLRYKGALDDDARGERSPEEREVWLGDALGAVRTGKEVARPESKSAG